MRRALVLAVMVALVVLLPTVRAGAEGTVCGHETIILADGRVTASSIPSGSTFFYLIGGQAGNSYSAEFRNATGSAIVPPGTLSVFQDVSCTSVLTTRDTGGIQPKDVYNMKRVSFTIPASTPAGGEIRFSLNNASGATLAYSFSVADTTMFSPAWSTNGTFDTFYSFLNTTNSTCTIALTMKDTSGTTRTTTSQAITGGATFSTNSISLGTPRNVTGTAQLTHDCPPGGILADAAVANFTLSPTPYFQDVKFIPVRDAGR